ncbi:MAG: hypothetical protein ABR954_05630 [Dehalococcoidales bacterium]
MRRKNKEIVTCPIVDYQSQSFLALAEHMNLTALNEHPGGEHTIWLEGFFKVSLEQICHHDKKVALKLQSYWKKHHSWPQIRDEGDT